MCIRDRVADYENLPPGTQLELPKLETLHQQYPQLCPADQSRPEKQNLALDSLRDSQQQQPSVYETTAGDTLYDISRQKLGQASRYVEILRLNETRLQPNIEQLSPLPAGVRLVLPADAR